MATFLENFKSSFAKSGITQAELSRRTRIPRSNIHDYLEGKYKPKQNRIELLAAALEVDPMWLASGNIKKVNFEEIQNLYIDKKPLTKKEKTQVINYVRLIRLMEKN